MATGDRRGIMAGAERAATKVSKEFSKTIICVIYVRGKKDFSIWIRRNPLKSPGSAKEKKEMQAFFLAFYLDLFGRDSPSGCISPYGASAVSTSSTQ